MNVSLYQAAAAMNANARYQDVIAGNMAASVIPGFKKQDVSFSAVQSGLLRGQSTDPLSPDMALLPQQSTVTNFQQGELKNTSVSTDMALEGKGFFEVTLPSGAQAYTRDGEFQINAQGQLATKEGYVVQGDGGSIQMDRNTSAPLSVSSDGTVTQAGTSRGKLKIVDFDKPELLTPLTAGVFAARNPTLQSSEGTAKVRQGMLEGANTTATSEMVNLISTMRSFEANQRIIQIEDERMGKVISELGSPN